MERGSNLHNPTDSYVQSLVEVYERHGDAEFAAWSERYFRHHFKFLGIRTPQRRKLTNQFIKEHGLPGKDELEAVISPLWNLPEREYQRAALDILQKMKRKLSAADMQWLVELVVEKSWWDTIDVLSPHIFGHLFSNDERLINQYAEEWIEDDNIWLQRTALLYQLFYKDKTDEGRLYRFILKQKDSDEFFVQKAIGWALREYSKTDPDSVEGFVDAHQLKQLSRREALKHIAAK